MEDKLFRLRRLKDALAAAGKTSREGIESWIARAGPVIESDWPDHVRGFQKAAATPPELASSDSQDLARQRRRIRQWSQDLFSFVSRLLKEAENAARPEPVKARRERAQRNEALKSPLGLTSIIFSVITFGVMVVAVAMAFKKGGPAGRPPETTFTVGPYGQQAPLLVKPYGFKVPPKAVGAKP